MVGLGMGIKLSEGRWCEGQACLALWMVETWLGTELLQH